MPPFESPNVVINNFREKVDSLVVQGVHVLAALSLSLTKASR